MDVHEQWYSAFGLTICSQLPVLEFPPITPRAQCDVHIIVQKPVDLSAAYGHRSFQFNIDVEQGKAVLYFSGVGEYSITAGGKIVLTPAQQADERTLALYLSGVVFAVLLYVRGCLVYHGSCVADADGRAVALVGDSGAGKSTLAAVLMQSGWSVLADDVVALEVSNTAARVLPAFPLLKIDPAMSQQIVPDAETLLPVQDGEVKRYVPLPVAETDTAYMLRAICFLELGETLSCSRISAREAMLKSIRFTMPTRLLQQVGRVEHFQQCATVSQNIPAFQVVRTDKPQDLEQLRRIIASSLAEEYSVP